jgi:3-dehydroquinate synthase
MKSLSLELGERSYPIHIGSQLLTTADLLAPHIISNQVMIVTNTTIAALYLPIMQESLSAYVCESIILPDGEQYKTLTYLEKILTALLVAKFNRDATLIALGGGVIGDMGGFAAACYQRGINFIQIPTTLLAQVDSSVGGKTGVNHALGKNMIGAFYQPQAVVIDLSLLNTLDDRQLSAGIAEIIKYGLIRDLQFFEWLENNMALLLQKKPQALAYAIEQSCLNKAAVVVDDEYESGIRAILNLGHTFAHAIETGMGYGHYLHGEAVAIGCCQAADLSHRLGYLSATMVTRIITLFKRSHLPITPPDRLTPQHYIEHMSVDKKNKNGKIHLIMLEKIGNATLPMPVDPDILKQTLNHYKGL